MSKKDKMDNSKSSQNIQQIMQESRRNVSIYQGKINMLKEKYNRLGAAEEELAMYQENLESHRSTLYETPSYIEGQWVGDYETSYDVAVYDDVYSITYQEYIQNIQDVRDEITVKMAELENSISEYEADIRAEARKVFDAINL